MGKATDFRLLFRGDRKSHRVYRTAQDGTSKIVQGPDSELLKFPKNLCARCNSARTQPHDQAWERFVRHIVENQTVCSGTAIDLSALFGPTHNESAVGLHLYFVKQIGCHAVQHNVDLPVTSFAVAILAGIAHPNVFLDFVAVDVADKTMDLVVGKLKTQSVNNVLVGAFWEYIVGNIGVLVSYAESQAQLPPQSKGWHPDQSPQVVTLR